MDFAFDVIPAEAGIQRRKPGFRFKPGMTSKRNGLMPHYTRETLEKVRKTISGYGMIQPGETVIVAVSGGPDSVCLLHILDRLREELQMKLVAAHFDHRLRPHEDESETEIVRTLASSLSLPFETETSGMDLSAAASLEEAAREARYAFLERVRSLHKGQKIPWHTISTIRPRPFS